MLEAGVDQREIPLQVGDHLQLADGADSRRELDRIDRAPGRVDHEETIAAVDRLRDLGEGSSRRVRRRSMSAVPGPSVSSLIPVESEAPRPASQRGSHVGAAENLDRLAKLHRLGTVAKARVGVADRLRGVHGEPEPTLVGELPQHPLSIIRLATIVITSGRVRALKFSSNSSRPS